MPYSKIFDIFTWKNIEINDKYPALNNCHKRLRNVIDEIKQDSFRRIQDSIIFSKIMKGRIPKLGKKHIGKKDSPIPPIQYKLP